MVALSAVLLIAAVCRLGRVSAGFATCDRTFEKMGCYKLESTKSSFSKLLVNDRDILDWNNYPASLLSLACRCAEKARQMQYKYIAIRYYGECWGGNDISSFIKNSDAKSTDCISNSYGVCTEAEKGECSGKEHSDYLYKLKASDVNGGYSQWSAWSACSASCGPGKKSRERSCNNPAPQGNGKDCSSLGPEAETADCQMKGCPIDGGYTAWSKYSKCSKSCGSGVMTRIRTCTNPKPQNDGKNCQGPSKMTKSCNTSPCPINGGYSKWSKYSKCSKSCGGGVMTKTRTCTNPRPQHGGKKCWGGSKIHRRCNTRSCPAKINHLVICEHDAGRTISCPYGKAISIKDAYYGRTSSKYCSYKRHFNLKCKSKTSPYLIKQSCNGKQSCYLVASNGLFGDPCLRTVKYLEIKYTCEYPKTINTYTCEHTPGKTIKCPTGSVIQVLYANYGRRLAALCPRGNRKNTRCSARSSRSKVKALCNNKQSCKMQASNKIFGDPCVGIHKYLYLKYRCIPRPTEVVILCEHRSRAIKCPKGYKINIVSATYGRLSLGHCRAGRRGHWNCKSALSLPKMRSICSGRQSCVAKASNSLFGDPCKFIYKYLQFQYQCLPY